MADEQQKNPSAGAAPKPASSEPKLLSVLLKKDHEHAGEKYKAGATIEVNEADEKWLRANGVV